MIDRPALATAEQVQFEVVYTPRDHGRDVNLGLFENLGDAVVRGLVMGCRTRINVIPVGEYEPIEMWQHLYPFTTLTDRVRSLGFNPIGGKRVA